MRRVLALSAVIAPCTLFLLHCIGEAPPIAARDPADAGVGVDGRSGDAAEVNDARLDAPDTSDAALPVACSNGVKDGAETDLDCGGSACAPCANTKACRGDLDCVSGRCWTNGTCGPWAKRIGGSQWEFLNAMAGDAAGNLYVAGRFSYDSSGNATAAIADFGLADGGVSANGSGFLAKISRTGQTEWVKVLRGSTGFEQVMTLALAPDGDIVVTGGVNSLGLGFSGVVPTGSTNLARFAPDGTLRWERFYALKGGSALAVDAVGDIFEVGIKDDSNAFTFPLADGGAFTFVNHPGSGRPDGFVMKFRGIDGQLLWGKDLGASFGDGVGYSPRQDWHCSIQTDVSGDLWVSGFLEDGWVPAALGLDAGVHSGTAHYDGYVARLAGQTGQTISARVFLSSAPEAVVTGGVAAASPGEVILTGAAGGAVNLGGADGGSGNDAFIGRYRSDAPAGAGFTHLWSVRGTGANSTGDLAGPPSVAASGSVTVAGYFAGTALTFGAETIQRPDAGNLSNGFVTKLSPAGTVSSLRLLSSTGPLWAWFNHANSTSANVVVAGTFSGTASLGAETPLVGDTAIFFGVPGDIFIVSLGNLP